MKNKNKICIINYGMGNIHSVYNALNSLGFQSFVTNNTEDLKKGDSFILPGVGAFSKAMSNLKNLNLIDEINKQILIKKKNILGICLGMQLLADFSEEGGINNGLSLIPGNVLDLSNKIKIRVPHIGWNAVKMNNNNNLFKNIESGQEFYFVHKYYYSCESKYLLAETNYEINVTAAINFENIYGVQFHPERSHNSGLKLLENYSKL